MASTLVVGIRGKLTFQSALVIYTAKGGGRFGRRIGASQLLHRHAPGRRPLPITPRTHLAADLRGLDRIDVVVFAARTIWTGSRMTKTSTAIRTITALLLLLYSVAAWSSTEIEPYLESPQLVGETRMHYLWWDVYDIQLFATRGNWSADKPFALRLNYLMALKGKAIAKRSIKEIRGLGFKDRVKLDKWQALMEQTFPDVEAGDSLVGIYTQKHTTVFLHNGQLLGEISDPLFGQYFFGIWLDPNTSEADMRKQLLGIP